jgi:hypothetical protein
MRSKHGGKKARAAAERAGQAAGDAKDAATGGGVLALRPQRRKLALAGAGAAAAAFAVLVTLVARRSRD